MKYTTEEKILISQSHPEIEIESIEFENALFTFGDDSPIEQICFISDNVKDAYFSGKTADGLYVRFRFRDKGAKFGEKYISFNDFAQIHDSESDEEYNYDCELVPVIVFNASADDEGRFSIALPMVLREVTEENENEILADVLTEHEALFMFGEITVGNQFVNEKFSYVSGTVCQKGGDANISRMSARYELANYDAEEDN